MEIRFIDSFHKLGDHLTENLPTFLVFLLVLGLTILAAYLFRLFFNRFVIKSSRLIKNDPTNYKFLGHVLVAIIYIIGIGIAVYETSALRTLATSMLAGAGILALAVGFASQQALSNLVSGIMIVIFKPFRVNDRLNLQGFNGMVEDITLRHTVIRDFENKRIIVPNTVISNEILINADLDDPLVCRFIEFTFNFDEDLSKVRAIMSEEISNHPEFIDKRTVEDIENGIPLVVVRAVKVLEYGVLMRAYAWAGDNGKAFVLGTDVTETILVRFKADNIKIGYPHRNISLIGNAKIERVDDKEN